MSLCFFSFVFVSLWQEKLGTTSVQRSSFNVLKWIIICNISSLIYSVLCRASVSDLTAVVAVSGRSHFDADGRMISS